MQKNIFLIGTGQMALDYAKVLAAQRHQFTVIGRGENSARNFYIETGINPIVGGIEKFLMNQSLPKNSHVIIATGTEALMPSLIRLLNGGAEKVLIEKPAAISIEELIENEDNFMPFSNKVFVAYNRRFYASVIEAKRLIEEDGGLQSLHFEFTEWAHKIEPINKAPGVKENWFFANSTHVVDLAFFLAGNPSEMQSYNKSGELTWHKKSNFAGAGITEMGVLFSYIANWESAGRWAIELLTAKRRIYLKPIERIGIQNKGTITVQDYAFDDSLDKEFKPGLYKQVEGFLNVDSTKLLNLSDHVKKTKMIYNEILN